jgi:hypothetical protein
LNEFYKEDHSRSLVYFSSFIGAAMAKISKQENAGVPLNNWQSWQLGSRQFFDRLDCSTFLKGFVDGHG